MPFSTHTKITVTANNIDDVIHKYNTRSNGAILRAAIEYGCTVQWFPDLYTFRIEHEGQSVFFYHMHNPLNTASSAQLANDKHLTNAILGRADLPVSRSTMVTKKQFVKEDYDISTLSFPLVVKPVSDSCSGWGVVVNIQNDDELQGVLKTSFETFPRVLVEEYFEAPKEYRVLILDGKVIAAIERIRAYVTGDGQHSIQELIDQKNTKRSAAQHISLGKIPLNDELYQLLQQEHLEIDSILEDGRIVYLQRAANAGRGGEFADVTDEITADNEALCVQATDELGLRFAGLDILVDDIQKPIAEHGRLIEVNEYPGITCHIYPNIGKSRPVHRQIVDSLFADA